ncbi:MAG TPA: hypothetical protein VFA03_08630 [Acetobacteraceae bacterium]|nr:hypothetical protein [Acetobacteraceae bacterium]
MSQSNPPSGNAPEPPPEGGANAAQEAFGRYKSRLAAAPMAMGMMPSWGMPPSMGMVPGFPFAPPGTERPHPLGSLTERLGATLRLGIDLLNASLASGASALGGGMAMPHWGGHGGGCGCGEDRCGYDCCEVMGCGCCRPGAHGCGCGCGCC